MARAHNFNIAAINDHLGAQVIISRREVDHCPGLSPFMEIRLALMGF